jgi:hypothetical protein
MLLKISEQIADCLARAADARERAQAIAEPKIKAMYFDLESRWMALAESYRFVERADQFLDDAELHRLPIDLAPRLKSDNSHLTPIQCDACGYKAHLMKCAPCTVTRGVREIWTYRCELCGEELKRVVEK